jgi:hypothetical protein
MQLLCKSYRTECDVHCPVCNQGFDIFWDHTPLAQRDQAAQVILQGLAAHHAEPHAHRVHPSVGFYVPNWPGSPTYSTASLVGVPKGW